MKTIFKKGDSVFCYMFGGWGEVVKEDNQFTICCEFPEGTIYFTKDGRYLDLKGIPPILSFTEYTLEGFSQERPEELPKKGDIVWVRKEFPSEWEIGHFLEKFNDKYILSRDNKNGDGWGYEIRTTNPYENEN